MYRVLLENGQQVRVGLTTASRHTMVRLIAGDRVELRLSGNDPTRGQITRKL